MIKHKTPVKRRHNWNDFRRNIFLARKKEEQKEMILSRTSTSEWDEIAAWVGICFIIIICLEKDDVLKIKDFHRIRKLIESPIIIKMWRYLSTPISAVTLFTWAIQGNNIFLENKKEKKTLETVTNNLHQMKMCVGLLRRRFRFNS